MVLKPRLLAPDWRGGGKPGQAAKCLIFETPEDGRDPWFDPKQAEDCLEVCNGDADGIVCPLRPKCLEWAVINNEAAGVWGGMLPHDRRRIRLDRKEDPYLEIEWHAPTPKDPSLVEDDLLLGAEEYEEYEDEVYLLLVDEPLSA